jgi:hypothetical protein
MNALLRKRADAETSSRNCRNSWAKKVQGQSGCRLRQPNIADVAKAPADRAIVGQQQEQLTLSNPPKPNVTLGVGLERK